MADSCGDYISADDLKAGKQSILHIEHVATSKDAQGNPALTVTDTIRGNEVTNTTLDGLFADIGFKPVNGSFEDGATLNNRWEVLLYESNGQYYQWMGALPKTVPAGSTPASTGGIGPNAWINQNDLTLRSQLVSETGGNLVGYKNPFSQVSENVKSALDKLNTRIIYAADFGVKTDSSDNADALWLLGQAISNSTVPLYVIFPKGVSLVGSQQLAGATGQGYSYRPTYFSRAWGDASDRGWFSVHRTNNDIVLDMSGWELKMNAGMKLGSFDPTTGASYTPSSLPFYSVDYQATQGFLIKIYQAPNVKVIRGTTNGNLQNAVWGGFYGDTGYQVNSYNWWFNQSTGVEVYDHVAKNAPNDGFYHGETGSSFTPGVTTQIKGSFFKRCIIQDCGRNNISYTGGAHAVFEDCEIWRSGRNATGISGHGSGPESCLDVEAEGGNIYNLRFIRCKFMYGGEYGVVGGFANPYDVNQVYFEQCTFHCESGSFAFVNYARNVHLHKCKVYGSTSLDTGTKQDATKITNCEFYNRVDGRYIPNFSISGICDVFDDNYISLEIPTTAMPASPVFNLTAYQPLVGGYGNKASARNLRIDLSGNSNNVTHTDLGGFTAYRNVSAYVSALGVTGTKNLAIYMLDSRPSLEGLSVSGSTLVNFGGAMVNQPGTGIYWDKANRIPAPGAFVPQIDGEENLGLRGVEWANVYSKAGVFTRSPNGTLYQVSVNNSGSVVVTNIP